MSLSHIQIARVCHEANRAYCESIGDHSQKPWDDSPAWQQALAYSGVLHAQNYPDAPVSDQHDAWLADKERDGWKYGTVKDPEKKEHPCCVPYDQLPEEQKRKEALFKAVVRALA